MIRMEKKMYQIKSKKFMDIYKLLGDKYGHMDVFFDFIKMSAIAIYNSLAKNQTMEQEYLKIINSYEKKDQNLFPQWFSELVMMYENAHDIVDILGAFYETEHFGNSHLGQFFTPTHISDLMAKITIGDSNTIKKQIAEQGFISFNEPTCGAGGMILSYAKVLA